MFFRGSKFSKIIEILGLEKPLVIFDIETTGPLLSTDKIIEIAYLKIWGNDKVQREDIFINPEMPIGKEAGTVHGLNDGNLGDKPTFHDKAQELFDVFNDCYYGGFNIVKFDLPILRREFVRVGMDFEYATEQIIDAREIFRYLEPKNLAAAYSHYLHKEIKQKPGAMGDTEITAEVLLAQMEKYQDLMRLDFIKSIYYPGAEGYRDNSQKFYWRKGETYFSFSKYKDQKVADVATTNPEFLHWMLVNDFSNETKAIIQQALAKNKSQEQ